MGSTVIILIFLFHLITTINTLLNNYNNLVGYINTKYNTTMHYNEVIFFGSEMHSISLLVDIIIILIIIIISLIIYLSIKWSVKESG